MIAVNNSHEAARKIRFTQFSPQGELDLRVADSQVSRGELRARSEKTPPAIWNSRFYPKKLIKNGAVRSPRTAPFPLR